MKGTQYTTKEEILKRAQEIRGIPLYRVDKTGRLETGKGAIGIVVEESWFGYTANSESQPDFPEAGVELKVTPYIRGRNGIRAKERLVCNIINYMEEYSKRFETSAFWNKCNTMLLMSYEHLPDKSKRDYKIDEAILFRFPEEDLPIIKHDWETIMNKVRCGKAHELSEGDTMYLAACTKGANSLSVREQPFSDIPAKQRAYSLKASYMTRVLNKYIFGNVENEHIIKNWRKLKHYSFEDCVLERLSPFYGKTITYLKGVCNVDSSAKNVNEIILAKLLGIEGKISQAEEFKKANIIPKTIRVQKNGKIKENMSFPTFDFIQLSQEEVWEESELYNYLAPTKFMFVIFKEIFGGEYIFERVMFWNIPNRDLDEVGRVWRKTVDTIRGGVVLRKTPHGISNNLPKQTESLIAHVRPHAKNAADRLPLPDGRLMTKQCFWLNNSYIKQQIEKGM